MTQLIVFLVWAAGAAADLLVTGYVEERWGFDDNVTRELCLVGAIVWPVVLFCVALFWTGRGLARLGASLDRR